jgi:hypothetical protein
MFRLLTKCPEKGDIVATHAVMPRRAFQKLKTDLIFFCSSCRTPHAVSRQGVWLEDFVPPGEQKAGDQDRM